MLAGNSPSQDDIAEQAKASHTTVLFILNITPGKLIAQQTRSKVLEITEKLTYVPNDLGKSVARYKSKKLGMIIGHTGSMYFDN